MRACIVGTATILILSWSFWAYGGVRVLAETVGFDAWVTLWTMSFAALPLLVALPTVWFSQKSTWRRTAGAVMTIFMVAVLIGGLTAELFISQDEAAFRDEVGQQANVGKNVPYARARVWPFVDAALIYRPSRGIHATD